MKIITSAAEFGRVAVLMGGSSNERELSLISGKTVLTALKQRGVDAYRLDTRSNVAEQLISGKFDRAFVILHGRGGEDGQIQGLLRSIGIPFTGSDITGTALSMNKMLSKEIWMQQGLPTAIFKSITREYNIDDIVQCLGLPLIIKPVNEGSSIGITKVNSNSELLIAIESATKFDSEVMAEHWINGTEYTIAVLNRTALPVIRINTPHTFYNFTAKYHSNTTEYSCPSNLSKDDELYCQELAVKAFDGLRMKGWGRIDMMQDQSGHFYLLEANSVPGLTDHSLLPIAARQFGLNLNELIWQILETSVRVNK